MEQVLNIGRIEDSFSGKAFRLAGISRIEGYNLKKIFLGDHSDNWVKEQYPGTEIVQDAQSIIKDEHIDLVIMPTRQHDELELVAQVLQTGKNIRIV